MADDTKEVIRRRVEAVQRVHEGHGRMFRVLWVVAGATIFVAGLAMTVFPGPAVIVLPVGLAMLAAEFTWARSLLAVGIDRGVDTKRRIEGASTMVKLLTTLSVLCLAGAAVAFLVLR